MSRHDRWRSPARCWERVVAWTVVAAVLVAALGSGLAWLRSIGDDEVVVADVVVVLGGGDGERVALGRELTEQYEVPLVLSSGAILQGWRAGLTCDEPVRCELPEPDATRGEARMVAALAETHGWEQVVVTTTRFHVGRTRLLMRQCLDQVVVLGATDPDPPPLRIWAYGREAVATLAAVSVHRAC